MRDPQLIADLIRSGRKCSPDDILFIVKEGPDKFVWLEKGNSAGGFVHIKERHFDEYKKLGFDNDDRIIHCLYELITQGNLITIYPSKDGNGEDRVYDLDGVHYIISGIGNNGFIVTAYPHTHRKEA